MDYMEKYNELSRGDQLCSQIFLRKYKYVNQRILDGKAKCLQNK